MSALRSIVSICGESHPLIAEQISLRASVMHATRSAVFMLLSSSILGPAELLWPLVHNALGLEFIPGQAARLYRLYLQSDVQRLVDPISRLPRGLVPKLTLVRDRLLRLEAHSHDIVVVLTRKHQLIMHADAWDFRQQIFHRRLINVGASHRDHEIGSTEDRSF